MNKTGKDHYELKQPNQSAESIFTQANALSEAGFKEKVEQLKAQKAYLKALERANPALAKVTREFETKTKVFKKNREKLSKEFEYRPSKQSMQSILFPPTCIVDITGAAFKAKWKEYLPNYDIRPARVYFLDFTGGYGFGGLEPVKPVDHCKEGYMGWMDQLQVENDDTGKTVFSCLRLSWEILIPRTGNYSYDLSNLNVWVNIDYDLEGSGLWGLDALINVQHRAALLLSGPSGGGLISNINQLVFYADQSTFLGQQQKIGTEWGWFPIGSKGTFRALKGESVTLMLWLAFWTWADNGTVRFAVLDYWLPCNTNSDISIRLT